MYNLTWAKTIVPGAIFWDLKENMGAAFPHVCLSTQRHWPVTLIPGLPEVQGLGVTLNV